MTDQISDKELGEIYEFAVQLGKDAGKVLMAGAQIRIGPSNGVSNEQKSVEKDSSVDIVTQTDEGEFFVCWIGPCFSISSLVNSERG